MKRWNIKSILLYSHDERKRSLDFELEGVNIITGNSRTGKSAISEIIDYVMGSDNCHIPVRVRHYCTWVGILWVRSNTELLMCRRTPQGTALTSSDYMVDISNNAKIPASSSEIKRNMSRPEALKKFEQLLGMGDAQGETFNELRDSDRISLRNTVTYMLQDDDIILSKLHLLKGSGDEHRQSIIDCLPYFLGVTDSSSFAKEGELRRAKSQLAGIERRKSSQKKVREQADEQLISLFIEAKSLDLIDENIAGRNNDEIRNNLLNIISADNNRISFGNNDTFLALFKRKGKLEVRITETRKKIRFAKELIQDSEEFQATSTSQSRRLAVVNLLPTNNETHNCPVCDNPLLEKSKIVEAIRNAYTRVQNDLSQVERERPKIDSRIDAWQSELERFQELVSLVSGQMASIIQNSDYSNQMALDEQRHEVRGKVRMYFQVYTKESEQDFSSELLRLAGLVESLEAEISKEAKLELLQDTRIRLSNIATAIIAELPFEDQYKQLPIDFNPRNLTLGLITPIQRLEMRDIGADENYLSMHVSMILAIHRYFAKFSRPVPGVILFDQLSRPYFPQDIEEEVVYYDGENGSNDREHLKMYFDVLFNEVNRQESLQVIVLEHAYFADDPRFVKATKERWITPENRLVPIDWPRAM
jgi:hypothetical protein